MSDYVLQKYTIGKVKSGMTVGKDVLTEDGQVILNEGTLLTDKLINGLLFWDVQHVFIKEQPLLYQEKAVSVSPIEQKFHNTYDEAIDRIKNAFELMKHAKEIPLDDLEEISTLEVFPLLDSVGVVNHLHMVTRQDDYTLHHSVNVAVMCGVLGKWLGYKGRELKELILSGLLHDVGKIQISLSILNKPGKLTEEEMKIMQTHPALGYEMIRDVSGLSANVGYGILQHHERLDGSGYPFKLKGNQIHKFAKIIAVADIYDAMTSDRVYQNKATPFSVVEVMVEEMFNKLDASICSVFLNNVRDYFVGNVVKLSDGRNAEVVYLGQIVGARPTVRTQDNNFIDLERRKDIRIVDLVKT